MKKIAALLTFLIVLTGCVDSETRVIVKRDGSGEIHVTNLMTRERYEYMRQAMTGEEKGGDGAEQKELYDMDKLEKQAGDFGSDVVLKKVETITTDRAVGYRAIYQYPDIGAVSISQQLHKSGSITGQESVSQPITFILDRKDGAAVLSVSIPRSEQETEKVSADSMSPGDEEYMNRQIAMAQATLDGFRIALMVEVGGKVVKSSARHQTGSTFTVYDFAFSEILKNDKKLRELSRASITTTGDMGAALQDMPGMIYEPGEKVVVEFE